MAEIELFTQKQSLEISASFVDLLLKECPGQFTSEGMANLSRFKDCVQRDPFYPRAWKNVYEDTFGRPFKRNTTLNSAMIHTLLIEVFLRCTFRWDLDLSEAVRLCYKRIFQPQSHLKETALYEKAVRSPLKVELLQEPIFFTEKDKQYSHKKSSNSLLYNQSEWMEVYDFFFWHLVDYSKDLFSEEGFDAFTLVGSFWLDDPATAEDLENLYNKFFGLTDLFTRFMNLEEAFTLYGLFYAWHVFEMHMESREALNYICTIRHDQANRLGEWHILYTEWSKVDPCGHY